MSEAIKILIAEDEGIIREALSLLINSFEGVKTVGEATTGEEAVGKTLELMPDLVLMDLRMPGMSGVEATRLIKEKNPGIKIMALTAATEGKMITDALSAGADGFVIKKGSGAELKNAIFSVLGGRRYICPEAAIIIAESYMTEKRKNSSPFTNLNRTEKDILDLICQGMRAVDISAKLGISKKTVEKYRDSLRMKVGAATAAELVAAYLEFKRTSET
jgi:two-component system invasion response regulator UvrY